MPNRSNSPKTRARRVNPAVEGLEGRRLLAAALVADFNTYPASSSPAAAGVNVGG